MNEAIDIHTHVVPANLPAALGGMDSLPWPSVKHGECGHATVLMGGKSYREIDERCWDSARRISDMSDMGLGRQILSPMPELLSYWLPPPAAQVVARSVNEQIAALVQTAPERFRGFGMVPLQSVDLAIAELAHATETLGLTGIELGTNIEEKPLGHPSLEPFFAEVEARGIPVFVHPLRPAGMNRLIGPPTLEQILAFPGETALTIASILTSGLLVKHPKLRLAFSHGGGTFAQLLPRLQYGWSITPSFQAALPRSPREMARDLFYDTLVYDPTTLRFLAEQFGIGQLMVGTDYPFAIMEKKPLERLAEAGFSAEDRARITSRNAARFLGEP